MAQKCTYPGCNREDIAFKLDMNWDGEKKIAFLCISHMDIKNPILQPIWISQTDAKG